MIGKVEGYIQKNMTTDMKDGMLKVYDVIDFDIFQIDCQIHRINGEIVIEFDGLTIKVPVAKVVFGDELK